MSEIRSIEPFDAEVVHQRFPLEDKAVRLRVETRRLFFDDVELGVPNGFLCGGLEQIPDGRFRVLFAAERKSGKIYAPWSVIVPDRATARSILRAAGVDAEQRALELRFKATLSAPVIVAGMLLSAFLLLPEFSRGGNHVLFKMLLIVFGAAIFCGFLLWIGRSAVTLGTDGILYRRYGFTNFVPFSVMRSVALTQLALTVERMDGKHVVLAQFVSMAPHDELRQEDCFAEVIAMRIRDAIANQEKTGATATGERRKMPIADWIRELRENPILPPSYRMSPRREHDHNRVLEDMTADVVTRACAAIALRVREGETVVPRLRIAAAATASPKLRIALEKIADGAPDEEIARRIEKLR